MSDNRQHDHIRKAFFTMRKGEVVWLKMSPLVHRKMYHFQKPHVDATKIGDWIYLKLYVESIKRDPPLANNQPYETNLAYFKMIRELCKELIIEGEFTNAKNLYSRCLGPFKNMPKTVRDNLNEEQKQEREDILLVL
mmetsp:Transcript_34646/g.53006  ORF Transcript_34646/g.53006 Transcript_34646/m.53006 type:complete len:137 (-) Transcript_34646:522-932(-)